MTVERDEISNQQLRLFQRLGMNLYWIAEKEDLDASLIDTALNSDAPLHPEVQDTLFNAIGLLIDDYNMILMDPAAYEAYI